jgi:hypothetical protein
MRCSRLWVDVAIYNRQLSIADLREGRLRVVSASRDGQKPANSGRLSLFLTGQTVELNLMPLIFPDALVAATD